MFILHGEKLSAAQYMIFIILIPMAAALRLRFVIILRLLRYGKKK